MKKIKCHKQVGWQAWGKRITHPSNPNCTIAFLIGKHPQTGRKMYCVITRWPKHLDWKNPLIKVWIMLVWLIIGKPPQGFNPGQVEQFVTRTEGERLFVRMLRDGWRIEQLKAPLRLELTT